MTFILVYEVEDREFNNMLLLKLELERRGHRVILQCKDQDLIFKHKDAVALIPNSYHKKDLDAYRYKFNLQDNPIVIYSCEQLVNHTLPKDFDYSGKNPAKRVANFCWGPDYRDFLISLGYDEQKLYTTGAIQLDYCRKEFFSFYKTKKELATQFHLPVQKKWLLFISDFSFASESFTKLMMKGSSFDSSKISNRHRYEQKVQKEILHWFSDFLSSNDDYIIIYRKHPTEVKTDVVYAMEKKFPNKFFEITKLDLKQWIIACDRNANYYSTAAIESSVAGKASLLLRPWDLPDDMGVVEYPFYKEYPRISDNLQFIQAMQEDDAKGLDKVRSSLSKFFSFADKPAFMRVADALEDVARKNERYPMEAGYTSKKMHFLLKNHLILKCFIKYIYRKFYSMTRYVPKKETAMAIKAYVGYADNRKRMGDFSKKIKVILSQYFS